MSVKHLVWEMVCRVASGTRIAEPERVCTRGGCCIGELVQQSQVDNHIIDLSLASTDDFDALIQNIDTIHHCAWSTIPESANLDPLPPDLKVNRNHAGTS